MTTVRPADRLLQVSEYYFSKKLEQIRQMRASGSDVINLGIGSPDLFPVGTAVNAAVTSLQSEKSHGYASSRSTPELRKAMADWYARTYKVNVDPASQVLPLLGSKEGILYLSLAFLNPGDQVLIPNPGYPAYSSVASLIGAQPVYYDLCEGGEWYPDLEDLNKRDLSRCKLMWVNYPHMPTGKRASAEVFKNIIEFGREKNILICNDNPYGLVLNREAPLSLLTQDPGLEVGVELNSLSKSFNMAGWRVGMILASKVVIDAVLQVKSNVDSGMFLPIQAGAIAALEVDESWHLGRNEVYRERRKIVWSIFDQLGFHYDREQVGLFVWAKAPESVLDVEGFVDQLLDRSHVFLTPGFIFGTQGRGYARASLCAPVEVLREALHRLGGQP